MSIFSGLHVWFDVIVRVEGFYFDGTADALARREIEDTAKRRAIAGTAIEIVAEPGYLRTKYPRPITDDPDETEVLFAMVRPGAAEHYFSAAFVMIRYEHAKRGRDLIDALCTDLLASQRF